ncbi:MAG TPA: cytochrome c oxidase assembly protein [Beijerinckiaceae bacterium]|jgi:cytochrome c oxidase assembly protein subunit 11
MTDTPARTPQARAAQRTAVLCASLAVGMVGLAYASVPLYDLFCRMTGFGGTPIVRTTDATGVLDRTIAVRFDSNVAPGLNWRFQPEASKVEVKLGQTTTVMYKVTNVGPTPSTGIATFNVQPALAGAYFVKLQCFCFQEQTLQPGETIESAVVFYVDPALASDPNTKDYSAITLSYTYFPAKSLPAASASLVPRSN